MTPETSLTLDECKRRANQAADEERWAGGLRWNQDARALHPENTTLLFEKADQVMIILARAKSPDLVALIAIFGGFDRYRLFPEFEAMVNDAYTKLGLEFQPEPPSENGQERQDNPL